MWWSVLIILFVAVTAFLVKACADIGSGVWIKAICRQNTGRRTVVLTFDDGPDPVTTPKVLDILERHGAKACFFCIGSKAAEYPDIVGRIHREGHLVGIHTMTHKAGFPLYRKKAMKAEIEDCSNILHGITGTKPVLFRPPFGVTNPRIARVIRESGLSVAGWNIRTFDTTSPGHERILARVEKRLQPGSIILLHDRLPDADVLLEKILLLIENHGYKTELIDIGK